MTLLDIQHVFLQTKAKRYDRTQQILHKLGTTKITEVASHWQIPQLHKDSDGVDQWNCNKRQVLVIGVKGKMHCRENGRSTDYIAPSHANGCAMACSYCYVARRKGYANPITTFVNIEENITFIKKHAAALGTKTTPNQCDPDLWTYDIGENNDCSVDAMLSDNVKDIITTFAGLPNAKACFATKYVNTDLLSYDPQKKTRIRFSLMPQPVSTLVDVRTARISDRINAISDFVDAGYEVHVNFSPVIVYDGYLNDWRNMFIELNDALSPAAKKQLKCEIIFLTHNQELHQINKRWHPKAEKLLWKPELQEPKRSQTGGQNVRYRWRDKSQYLNQFKSLLRKHLPYCQIRYAF
jgi:spore photoproduct lyase